MTSIVSCGAPSIASALPGVRQPVLTTGMGEVVPIGDSAALAEAIIRILNNKAKYTRPRSDIEALFSTPRTAELYEQLFEKLIWEKSTPVARDTSVSVADDEK